MRTWERVPSPMSAALFTGLAGAGIALLLKKNPWTWGLVSGGGGFLASVAVKGSFAAGVTAGGMAAMQACVRNPQDVIAKYREIFGEDAAKDYVGAFDYHHHGWQQPDHGRSWGHRW